MGGWRPAAQDARQRLGSVEERSNVSLALCYSPEMQRLGLATLFVLTAATSAHAAEEADSTGVAKPPPRPRPSMHAPT